ncbi:hypothetical protein GCM10009630_32350 [Kribbella jejuensis]
MHHQFAGQLRVENQHLWSRPGGSFQHVTDLVDLGRYLHSWFLGQHSRQRSPQQRTVVPEYDSDHVPRPPWHRISDLETGRSRKVPVESRSVTPV